MKGSNEEKLDWTMQAMGTATLLIGVVAGIAIGAQAWWIAIFVVPGFIYLNRRANEFNSRYLGALGELKVRILLDDLYDQGVRARHNVHVDGRQEDVDHVVESPTGLWTIETKMSSRKIEWLKPEDVPKKWLQQAYAEAKAVGGGAKPVLVIAGRYAKVRFGLKPVDGVYVVGTSWLKKLLVG